MKSYGTGATHSTFGARFEDSMQHARTRGKMPGIDPISGLGPKSGFSETFQDSVQDSSSYLRHA